jgi:L-2-hydroxyglutarate oxidase LhgO
MRVVIIGAGAVGLATGRELAAAGHETFVLEAAAQPGTGVTSRNSEVIHAGLYYPPSSLKARLCVEGRRMVYEYLERKGEGVRRCGKLVVASDAAEIPRLEALHANAVRCGVEGLELVDAAEVRRRQPAVRAAAALWSPETGILDAHGLVRALRGDLERAGGTLVTNARVRGAERTASGYRLDVEIGGEREPFACDAVVNAAGLAADLVARLPGGGDPPSQRFVRGSYARLRWPRGAVAPPSCLVYPLPNHDRPGLGIHLTIDLAGGLRLGPDAEDLEGRAEEYPVPGDVVSRFEAAARRYLDLPDGAELTPDYAGIRPVRVGDRDFHIAEDLPGWVNCIGIESPGLTAALAIGRYVAALIPV